MVEQDELLEMLPCSHCKNEKPHLVSCRPEGRTADLWRVECPCEKAPTQWSVSKTAEGRSDLRGEALRESVSATQKSLVT